MQSLNNLVVQGKVLYLGVSDTPAWVVSKANQYARDHGLRQFCVYQGRWNAASRDFEREIIPMCRDEGSKQLLDTIFTPSRTNIPPSLAYTTRTSRAAGSEISYGHLMAHSSPCWHEAPSFIV